MTEEKLTRFLEFCRKNGFDITNPDSNQRKAILGSHYSVLPAGAGSGKTTVLTYRFLRLLMDDETEPIHSDEILTITFTKAATANMRAKIYLILKKAETEGLISSEEIGRFSNAEISTTDSFCSKIVRSDCTRYGISTSFRIEDEADYDTFIESSLKEIITEQIEKVSEVAHLCSLLSFDTLVRAYQTVAKNYINIALPFSGNCDEIYRNMKNETLDIVNYEMGRKKDAILDKAEGFLSSFTGCKSIEQDTAHVRHIISYLMEGKEIPEDSKFSKKYTVNEDRARDDVFKAMKTAIRDDFNKYMENKKYTSEENYGLLRGYAAILGPLQEKVLLHKREEGALTFHDVMLLAIDILRSNVSIRTYYNNRFKRIMVDEFQDNNEENKRLIYLLAAKPEFRETGRYPGVDDIILDKIFMVGDEKQSIYRFRGADVSVFKNISRDFGKERVLPLSENFRSENNLIETINKIFNNTIMPQYSEEEFEAEYTPLVSHRERVKPNVSFRYMNAKAAQRRDDRKLLAPNALCEGYEVARIISEEILGSEKEKFMVWDSREKREREPRYSDISILLRTGSNQSAFEKALRKFNIPFTVTDNKSLTMDAVMNDFYSVLQYSIYGDDDPLSYAAVLRSPFVNMDDQDIEVIIRNINNKAERTSGLSDDAKDRLVILDCLMSDIRELEKTASLTSLMHFLWFDCGYRYFIETEEKNESYAEHYDYLFAIAADFDSRGKGVVELLDRIRPSLGDTSDFKDTAVQREKKEGVTIQTIHKSKGLEYPIVFISDMGAKPKDDSFTISTLPVSGLPLFKCFPNDNGTLDNPISRIKKCDENRIENAEQKRILYVAATRSEHHLIFTSVFGTRSINKEGNISPLSETSKNSLLQYLVKGMNFNLEKRSDVIETREFEPVYRSVFKEKKEKKKTQNIKNIESWYEAPQEPKADEERKKVGVTTFIKEDPVRPDEIIPLPSIEADRLLNTTQYAEGLTDEEIKADKEKRITTFGTLVHLLLENAVLGLETDTSIFFKDDRNHTGIIESAFTLRDNFLSSDFRKQLECYSLYPEKEFYIKDGDTVVEGIIDLMCVSKEKVIIVDYKTDSIKAPERHRAQLGYYRHALSTIYSDRPIETYIFYLRSSEAVKLE